MKYQLKPALLRRQESRKFFTLRDAKPWLEGTGLDSESAVFIETSNIQCKDGRVVYNVRAVFEPDESWVDPAKKDNNLLAHEQGTFDIAELYARKLRKTLDGLASLCDDKKKFADAVQKALKQNADDYQSRAEVRH